ncbi:MAG: hypothetical protein O7H39_04165, partial [Gammaproteobacteria bacterium]|nr:hypothetical protein [Gammaproteobacteria bacterium]
MNSLKFDAMELECVEITGDQTPIGSVIWLHGLGADGHDFEPVIPSLTLDVPLRFVFPHAPIRAVTVNAGMEMRAWYDADPQSSLSGAEDIRESVRAVDALIEREIERGIAAENVVVAGFSQGGVIALELGLTSERRLRGVMALSTYLHDHERIADRVSFSSIETRIFDTRGGIDTFAASSDDLPGVNSSASVVGGTAVAGEVDTTIRFGDQSTMFRHNITAADTVSMEIGTVVDDVTVTPGEGTAIAINTGV